MLRTRCRSSQPAHRNASARLGEASLARSKVLLTMGTMLAIAVVGVLVFLVAQAPVGAKFAPSITLIFAVAGCVAIAVPIYVAAYVFCCAGLTEAAAGGRRRLSIDGRSVEVDIPRGVRDGQLIRIPGQGTPGTGGARPGDLILRIELLPDARFRVEGGDLYTDLPVAPWEAALGAEVPVPTLDGTAQVKVPAGSSSGRRLRLRGQGLPGNAQAPPGDLYAVVTIRVPKRLTKRERELFQQLADHSKFDPRKKR